MNWRGISGIYAGLAVVLGGAWLWVQYASVWALVAIGGGLLLAAASLVHIVRAGRGPRPAKATKAPRAWQRKAAPVADNEADQIARARMAAIAGRTTGRPIVVEPEAVQPVADFDVDAVALREPDEVVTTEAAISETVDDPVGTLPPHDIAVLEFQPEPESEPVLEAEQVPEPRPVVECVDPEPSQDPVAIDAAAADTETDVDSDSDGPDEADQVNPEPVATEEVTAALPVAADTMAAWDGNHATTDIAADEPEPPVVALDDLPGFPWTARFIGLWAREVRYACPDDLRGAVGHWQRWADEQSAGTPLVEEAADEFKAMLSAWRECGAEVPGLASDDPVSRKLVDEAAEDVALAALLPAVLRVRRKQEA
jgi:hypothetical protein